MDAVDFVQLIRSYTPTLPPPDILAPVAYIQDPDLAAEYWNDPHGDFREAVCVLLSKELHPTDRQFLRYLLEQEIASHRVNWGLADNLQRCAFLLATLGNVEDVFVLWDAKNVNFDAACGIDGQLLVGAGVAPTLSYLRSVADAEAPAITEAIEAYQADGLYNQLDAYFAQSYPEPENERSQMDGRTRERRRTRAWSRRARRRQDRGVFESWNRPDRLADLQVRRR